MYRVNKPAAISKLSCGMKWKKCVFLLLNIALDDIALDDIITLHSQRAGDRTRSSKSELYYKEDRRENGIFLGLISKELFLLNM